MENTEIALTVMEKRSLLRENGKVIETPQEMIFRVANYVASADEAYGATPEQVCQTENDFYRLMDEQLFMPNSPTFTGAKTKLGQLSACFVLPISDSLGQWGEDKDAIYDTMKAAALIHRTGGGTGFAFSRLREEGAIVHRTGRESSGPILFLKTYNASTEVIKQGGTRRGANMGVLRVDHPDILKFIHCKDNTSEITNFNISVGITYEFENALKAGRDYLINRDLWRGILDGDHLSSDEMDELCNLDLYPIRDPKTGSIVRHEHAVYVYWHMIRAAWATGEPGIFRIDEANRRNPNNNGLIYTYVNGQGEFVNAEGQTLKEGIETTNPCGEQPLPPYGSCNLGSINLASVVKDPYTDNARVDWMLLKWITRTSVHFLDNVIDKNKLPLPEIDAKTRADRRIGLGVMGMAEMLVQLELPYNSDEGVAMAAKVMLAIKDYAKEMSMELAETRGAYPEWEGSLWHQAGLKVRNATMTTVAPTGTISLYAAKPNMPCSGGIEPKFALVFVRNQAGSKMVDVDGQFRDIAVREGWYSEELMDRIAEHGSCQGVDGVPEKWQRLFVTAHDITPYWHVRMQAAFQGPADASVADCPIDAACSKTINFPHDASVSDVDTSFMMAIASGLKGLTVYRDGCRDNQVLTLGTQSPTEDTHTVEKLVELLPRPDKANGSMYKVATHFGNMTMDIHEMPDTGDPFEFIVNVGATGSDLMADAVAIGMLGSMILRMDSRIPAVRRVEMVIDKLRNIGGSMSYGFGPNKVTSLASAVALGLQRYLDDKAVTMVGTPGPLAPYLDLGHADTIIPVQTVADLCPECGNHTFSKAECVCKHCGFSVCK